MDTFSSKQALDLKSFFGGTFHNIWTIILAYVGATEEASKWWNSVFERRVLQGKIGVKLLWWRKTPLNVLWEVESIIKAFSDVELVKESQKDASMNIARFDASLNNIYHSNHPKDQHTPYIGQNKREVISEIINLDCKYEDNELLDLLYMNVNNEEVQSFQSGERGLKNIVNRRIKIKRSSSEIFNKKTKKLDSIKRSLSCPRMKVKKERYSIHWEDLSDMDSDDNDSELHHDYYYSEDSEREDNFDLNDPHFKESNVTDRAHLNLNNHHNEVEDRGSSVDVKFGGPSMALQRCPVADCSITDCLLNNKPDNVSLKPNIVCFRPSVGQFIQKINDTMRKAIIIDDTPVLISKPLERTKIVGTDISQRTMSTFRRLQQCKYMDLLEYLEALKFDVSIKPQSGPPNPIEAIQKSLGLEWTILPPEPTRDLAELDSKSPKQWENKRSKTVATNEWLLSVMRDNRRKWDKTKIIRAYRNPMHNSLVNVDKKRIGSNLYLNQKAAYRYYKLLTLTESKIKLSQLKSEKDRLVRIYEWKQKTLMNVVTIARDYYSDPTEINLHRWKNLKKEISQDHDSHTDVRMHVSSMPDYWPFFSFIIILVQFCFLVVMCSKFGIENHGIATKRFIHKENIPTFLGMESYSRLEEPNPWLGPPVKTFYVAGAVLAPCMRDDQRLFINTELMGYKPLTENNSEYFGCCETKSAYYSAAGTLTRSECTAMTMDIYHEWKKGVICSLRSFSEKSVAHIIKPCCIGQHGDCHMVSNEHCQAKDGTFHVNCDHCVQVNCLLDVCRLISSNSDIVHDPTTPWLPGYDSRWQWWRFLTAIPLTYGFIHYGSILLVEVLLMIPLETSAGWHRVMILYCCSSVAGQAIGSVVDPDLPHVGSTSGVGGILGVAVLELFQAWRFLQNPRWEAFKLSSLIVLHLLLGTFHLVSFFSLIGGFCVGTVGCLTIVPYITFGRRLSNLRLRLVLIGFCILLPTLISIQIMFHYVQELKICYFCVHIECIRYLPNMCKTYRYR